MISGIKRGEIFTFYMPIRDRDGQWTKDLIVRSEDVRVSFLDPQKFIFPPDPESFRYSARRLDLDPIAVTPHFIRVTLSARETDQEVIFVYFESQTSAWQSDCLEIRPRKSKNEHISQEQLDLVNHPPHRNPDPSGIECITVVEHRNFCIGNAMKYLWRTDEKGSPIQDLKKAIWYIQREIDRRVRLNEIASQKSE